MLMVNHKQKTDVDDLGSSASEDGEITLFSEQEINQVRELEPQPHSSQDSMPKTKRRKTSLDAASFQEMENKIDTLSNALFGLQEMMKNKGNSCQSV